MTNRIKSEELFLTDKRKFEKQRHEKTRKHNLEYKRLKWHEREEEDDQS